MMTFPIYGKIKKVPNHQQGYLSLCDTDMTCCIWYGGYSRPIKVDTLVPSKATNYCTKGVYVYLIIIYHNHSAFESFDMVYIGIVYDDTVYDSIDNLFHRKWYDQLALFFRGERLTSKGRKAGFVSRVEKRRNIAYNMEITTTYYSGQTLAPTKYKSCLHHLSPYWFRSSSGGHVGDIPWHAHISSARLICAVQTYPEAKTSVDCANHGLQPVESRNKSEY